jgi:threonine/homoserine/homoserine lactone efflux protein
MNALELLLRGIAAGLAIAAPVGPVNILCISRTLQKGRMAGLLTGFGAASADTLYGAIAGFSISIVISWLVREEFWLRLIGGLLLIGIGIVYFFKHPKSLENGKESSHSAYVTALLLTLTNPTTVLSFLAVLAALGLSEQRPPLMTLILVGGIFTGSMLWWIILAIGANHFRDKDNDRVTLWMNRIAGLAIGAFGLLMLILAKSTPSRP